MSTSEQGTRQGRMVQGRIVRIKPRQMPGPKPAVLDAPDSPRRQTAPAPADEPQTPLACHWCGRSIKRWNIIARRRNPPLCSRRCVGAWLARDP